MLNLPNSTLIAIPLLTLMVSVGSANRGKRGLSARKGWPHIHKNCVAKSHLLPPPQKKNRTENRNRVRVNSCALRPQKIRMVARCVRVAIDVNGKAKVVAGRWIGNLHLAQFWCSFSFGCNYLLIFSCFPCSLDDKKLDQMLKSAEKLHLSYLVFTSS